MIEYDKLLHFGACLVIGAVCSLILVMLKAPAVASCLGGFIAAMCAGVAKEYADNGKFDNRWDWGDIIADIIGATIGCLPGLIAL